MAINEESDNESVSLSDVEGVYKSNADLFYDYKRRINKIPQIWPYDPNDVTTNESGSITPENNLMAENLSDPNSNICEIFNWKHNNNFEVFKISFDD